MTDRYNAQRFIDIDKGIERFTKKMSATQTAIAGKQCNDSRVRGIDK